MEEKIQKLNKKIKEEVRRKFGRFYIEKTPQKQIIDIEGNPDCFILASDELEEKIAIMFLDYFENETQKASDEGYKQAIREVERAGGLEEYRKLIKRNRGDENT